MIAFATDIFHPAVTPLTTYTYTTRESEAEPVSAADGDRLPPGGLSLHHAFPGWFTTLHDARDEGTASSRHHPHIVEVLQHMRAVFDNEEVLDAIPLDAAANSGAWHAWQSYRAKSRTTGTRPAQAISPSDDATATSNTPAAPTRQQPGGARRPGEWNWQGVWEDRVRKSVQASKSDAVLYGNGNSSSAGGDVINFLRMDQQALEQAGVVPRLEVAS